MPGQLSSEKLVLTEDEDLKYLKGKGFSKILTITEREAHEVFL